MFDRDSEIVKVFIRRLEKDKAMIVERNDIII
jgi:hypothetical protein